MMKNLLSLCILILFTAMVKAQDKPALSADRPNVVFILADDLGWGDLHCYGHPYAKTPNLDKLASEGTRFERFYATGVTCCPSRTGFMTSRHPASYPKYPANYGLDGRTTVTELFKQNGYVTGHFGKWHLGPESKNNPVKDGTYGIDDIEVIGGNYSSEGGRDADLFGEATKFIEKNKDKPFYVNIWGHITHYQVDPVASWVDYFKDLKVNRSDFGYHMQSQFDDCEKIGGNIQQSMRNYLADVYSLDFQVGRLMKKLDELGLRENTIVIFSSDQGPAPVILGSDTPERYKIIADNTGVCPSQNMLGYAGILRGRKHTQYEGGVRIPFIIRWPGQVSANTVNKTSIVSGMDYLPTLCSLAGIQIDNDQFEGENMADAIKGSDQQRKTPLFWRVSSPRANPSMLEGNWKLHKKGDNYVLYDLSVDVKEMNDVAQQHPDIVNEMSKKMDKWVSSLPASYLKGKKKK